MAALFSFVEKLKPHIPPGGVAFTDKDEVWLFDNTAYRSSPSEPWSAEFVIAFFRHSKSIQDEVSDAAAALMYLLGDTANDEATHDRVRERITPFIRSIGSNLTVDAIFELNAEKIGQLNLGPSDANGISCQILTLPVVDPKTGHPPTAAGGPLCFKVLAKDTELDKTLKSTLEMGMTYLAEDGGWGVISDLDDTVKISCVNNHHLLLQNTFVNIPQHSHGLPELYKSINTAISTEAQPAPFFYVSASPYNLFPFLHKFLLESDYPNGTIMLRDMSWENVHSWFSIKTDSIFHALPVKTYKDDRFKKIGSWLPRTTWICVGDSSQSDPEAYAAFYNQLVALNKGGRVARIFIRKVIGVNPELEVKLNAPERFEKAFIGIPESVWKIFEDGHELMDEVEKLKSERAASNTLREVVA